MFTPYAALKAFLLSLPFVVEEDGALALNQQPRRWMRIVPSIVDAEGNDVGDAAGESVAVNAVFLHLSYATESSDPERDYLPTAVAIARFLRWQIYDPQSDEVIPNNAVPPVRPKN